MEKGWFNRGEQSEAMDGSYPILTSVNSVASCSKNSSKNESPRRNTPGRGSV